MTQVKQALRLFWISFLALFMEVTCIRWIPGSVVLMGYYTNLVLISSFLGMGIGCLLMHNRRDLFYFFAPLAALLISICYFSPSLIQNRFFSLLCIVALGIVALLTVYYAFPAKRKIVLIVIAMGTAIGAFPFLWAIHKGGGFAEWISRGYALMGGSNFSLNWLFVVPTIFLLNSALFISIGQLIGRELTHFQPIVGYSLNLLGSLAGVIAFGLSSYFRMPPLAWFGLTFIGMAPFLWRHKIYFTGSLALFILCLSFLSKTQTGQIEFWSPYYKIEVMNSLPEKRQPFSLTVNHNFHQVAQDLSEKTAHLAGIAGERSRYDLPYQISKPKKVLILGSGTGNDIAAALRAGVPEIHAVEIDPVILDLGYRYHPEDPYHHPQVKVYVTDARVFLKNTNETYDLIVFGTLDSQTLFSSMGNIRLDSYVYTKESVREVWNHLTEKGFLAVTFSVSQTWVGTKIYQLIKETFGHEPLVFYPKGKKRGEDHKVFIVSRDPRFSGQELRTTLARELYQTDPSVTLPTDDWPHLYIKRKSLSNEYVVIILMLSLFSILFTRALVWRSSEFHLTFFLLGVAFLLLETKSITYLALLFGSTWVVNCVVFSAILLTALFSNYVVHISRSRKITYWFVCLIAALFLNISLSPEKLLLGSQALRLLIASAFVALPIFFSGIIFATLFSSVKNPASALGSNLIGAVIGGFFEYTSLLFGSRMIYVFALTIYLIAWLSCRRNQPQHDVI